MSRIARPAALLLALVTQGACSGPDQRPPSADSAATAAASVVSSDGPPSNASAQIGAAGVAIAGFTTEPVTMMPWSDMWSVPGRLALDAAATEPIGSIVEGRVMKVYASPGDRVRKGQTLVAIHSHELMDARAELARARSGLARAESDHRVVTSAADRAERLYGIKALSLAELERARGTRVDADATRQAARAELDRAEAFLEHLVGDGPLPAGYDPHWVLIRAPMNGQVIGREVQPGNVVLVGAALLTVSRTSALTLVLQLPEAAMGAARAGAAVQFTVAAHPARTFDARVTRVYPAIDTLTRTVEVHAAVSDPAGLLKAEMFANAELRGASSAATRVVPAGAVQALDGDTVVIAVQREGEGMRLEAVPVQVGRRTRDRVEILAGIDAGRTVIVGGAAIAKAEILKQRGGG